MARIVWMYLLDLDNASPLAWQAWAEETILTIDFIPPFWLCELTAADSMQTALACVRDGAGLECAVFPAGDVDEQSLLFGLLYSRFAGHEERTQEAWRVTADFGDIAEYVDSGHWRRYQRDSEVDISGMYFEERTSMIFRPVAAYALRTMRRTFKKSMHIKELVRRLRR